MTTWPLPSDARTSPPPRGARDARRAVDVRPHRPALRPRQPRCSPAGSTCAGGAAPWTRWACRPGARPRPVHGHGRSPRRGAADATARAGASASTSRPRCWRAAAGKLARAQPGRARGRSSPGTPSACPWRAGALRRRPRRVRHPQRRRSRGRALPSCRRVLRPGGRLVVLEFSTPRGLFGLLYRRLFAPRAAARRGLDQRRPRRLRVPAGVGGPLRRPPPRSARAWRRPASRACAGRRSPAASRTSSRATRPVTPLAATLQKAVAPAGAAARRRSWRPGCARSRTRPRPASATCASRASASWTSLLTRLRVGRGGGAAGRGGARGARAARARAPACSGAPRPSRASTAAAWAR